MWLSVFIGLLFGQLVAVSAQTPGGPEEKEHKAVQPQFAGLHIPRLEAGPALSDFQGMRPGSAIALKMLKVEGFVQRDPKDGAPVSQRTEVYLGYTDKNLYVVCLCFDSDPKKIRSHRTRREAINDDDQFGFVLDTFHDKQHGLFFYLNPAGIQQDGIWSDQTEPDYSYDMLWNSDAKLTAEGFIAWFQIPFKSLRFSPASIQTWGIFFERDIRRNNEDAFYPRITSDAQGFMAQETDMDGLEKISPSHNMQFAPYASLKSYRYLNDLDPAHPFFSGKDLQGRIGLDAKFVLKNALVLDATINPDFAQVESDEPQITVNQRFEVYFPEKRPFFLENSSFFDTPVNLVFTRRIADPGYGVRLTGKVDKWAIGALFADDKSPGEAVPPGDGLRGTKAYYAIARVSRDIGKESSLGFIYTDREMNTVTPSMTVCIDDPCIIRVNRVGGVDTKLKLTPKWLLLAQAITSYTEYNDGTHQGGPSYLVDVERSSRNLEFESRYRDTAEGFFTEPGFFQRPDIRRYNQFVQYRFRRENGPLQWHGPSAFAYAIWDHTGLGLEHFANVNYRFVFHRQTAFGAFVNGGPETLRHKDYDAIPTTLEYPHNHQGFFFTFGYFKPVLVIGEIDRGQDTNYDPAVGPPVLAKSDSASINATIRPFTGLTIENEYLFQRLRETNGASIFNNHIIRSKWNYQFTREFSVRFIGQYSSVLSNPANSALQTTKNFDVDFLATYLLHPGTALYVGYNSNLQNLDPSLQLDPDGNLQRTRNGYINDGRQFFVKLSYVFRF